MGNLLANASFLDGDTNWAAVSGGLAFDEVTLGAPGRRVLTGSGGAYSAEVPVSGIVEAFIWISGTGGDARLAWSGGASTPLVLSRPATTPSKRGVPTSFDYFYVRTDAQSGSVRIVGEGSGSRAILKPYIGPAAPWPGRRVWDPGSHSNPDLQLPIWPSSLRPVQASSNPQPVANARAFSTDSNIPIREDLYTGLHYQFKGEVRVTPDELDDLELLYETARDGFFFVDPFSDRLCIAEWLADGAPTFSSDQGLTAIYSFGLHLTVA